MGALIDTSVLIDIERRGAPSSELLGLDEEIFLCAITIGELALGVENTTSALKRAANAQFLAALVALLPCLAVDHAVALVYGRIASDLRSRGTPIGVHDTWIAATAMFHGLAVLTGNVKHFERVTGLQVKPWTH